MGRGKLTKENYDLMVSDLKKIWIRKNEYPKNPSDVAKRFGLTKQAAYNAYYKFEPEWNAQTIRKKKAS